MFTISKKTTITFVIAMCVLALTLWGQNAPQTTGDAIDRGRQSNRPAATRPEQAKNAHDQSNVFSANSAQPASEVSKDQPKSGRITGFDFYRDPLNADQPNINPDDIVKKGRPTDRM